MNIQYRIASHGDWRAIAQLHTTSWQENYRGSFSDHYLDNEAAEERAEVWRKRFAMPKINQYVILVENENKLCGFSCTYGAHDEHGSLLDNLHVSRAMRSRGIGAELLRRSAQWAFEHYPNNPFHLYVLRQNERGIAFYRRMGARLSDIILSATPDGGKAEVFMCTWPNYDSIDIIV